MIAVKFLEGGVVTVDWQDGLSAAQMVNQIKTDNLLRFAGNTYTLQDTITGRVISDNEILVDGRLYNLNAWLMPAPQE
jgi:hypothetical protein